MFDQIALSRIREAYAQLLRGRTGAQAKAVLDCVADHWVGKPPREWVGHVFGDHVPLQLRSLGSERMSRSALKRFLVETGDPQQALAAILAWGGSSYRQVDGLVETWDGWARTFSELRGKPALDQYRRYLADTKSGALKGLGPAFFTKAIFFTASPDAPGYIMDQWTARSANVLLNQPDFVALAKGEKRKDPDGVMRPRGFSVSHRNSVERYAEFNGLVEQLAEEIACSPEHAELIMFSKATWWRAYVASRSNEPRLTDTDHLQ